MPKRPHGPDPSDDIRNVFRSDRPTPGDDTSSRAEPSTGDRARSRRRLVGLSSRAYEHPADRAALVAMRKVPAFDMLVSKVFGLVGERRLRYLFLASAVRVGPDQFARLNAIYDECIEALDCESRPDLYVSQAPFVNAGAVGVDEPFIVLNSAVLQLMDDDELRFVLGHELGHVLSGHVLYKTMLRLLVNLALIRFGMPLGSLALFGIIAALREWDRKSELSADRAGLLAVQEPRVAYTAHLKAAGGGAASEMNVEAFLRQAADYERAGSLLDGVTKLMNLFGRSHPFHVQRTAELVRWVDSGDYQRILDGDYASRTEDVHASVVEEFAEGAKSYRDRYDESGDPLIGFLRDISSAMGDAGSNIWSQIKDVFERRDDDKS